jgi:hypothetical protein
LWGPGKFGRERERDRDRDRASAGARAVTTDRSLVDTVSRHNNIARRDGEEYDMGLSGPLVRIGNRVMRLTQVLSALQRAPMPEAERQARMQDLLRMVLESRVARGDDDDDDEDDSNDDDNDDDDDGEGGEDDGSHSDDSGDSDASEGVGAPATRRARLEAAEGAGEHVALPTNGEVEEESDSERDHADDGSDDNSGDVFSGAEDDGDTDDSASEDADDELFVMDDAARGRTHVGESDADDEGDGSAERESVMRSLRLAAARLTAEPRAELAPTASAERGALSREGVSEPKGAAKLAPTPP